MTDFNLILSQVRQRLEILYQIVDRLEAESGGGGGAGGDTGDYNDLTNKPKINSVTLSGNKSSSDLGLASTSDLEGKANAADVYTKSEVYNKTEVYTKAETTAEIGGAINDLDVSSTSTSGHYIKSIAQENGLIVPVADTVQDYLSPSSTHPVTSGAVYSANQTLDEKITKNTSALAESIDSGAKNRAEIMLGTATYNNLTFTVDKEAGTITVSTDGNPASQYKGFRFLGNPDYTGWAYGVPIPRGTYVVRGINPTMTQTGMRYIIGITTSSESTRTTTQIWTDSEFTVSNDTTRIDMALYVPTGWTTNEPQVCKPMICLKELWNIAPTLTPYAPTNAELYTMIQALQSGTRSGATTQSLSQLSMGLDENDLTVEPNDEEMR